MSPRPNVEIQRRQQILEAAMTCFATKGYHQTTTDDIAAELPFSKGLLYYYFKTKRDIFLAILENWMDTTLQAWVTILSPQDEPATQLAKCLNYGLQLISQNSDLARVEFEFFGELGRDQAISDAFKNLFSRMRSQIKAILEEGIRNGDFRPMDADALAAALLGFYEGMAMQALVEPQGFDWTAVSDVLNEIVRRGLYRDGNQ